MSANQVPAAAKAPVAAQAIEENASAKVATRDEVWRRRKWLRRACVRNHNWIAVAEAAAAMIARKADTASVGEISASPSAKGAKTMAMPPMTASILARNRSRAPTGADDTRSGASSDRKS